MDPFFHITTENGQFYYTLLYQLSFLLAFIIFIYIGIRKKYPLHTWLLLGAVATIFFIIGSKVGTYSMEDWKFLFTNGQFVEVYSKSLIGGLMLSLASILIAKNWLKFRPSLIDAYAIILPSALISQRVGCLLAGCCFGTPTTLPWGVQYATHFSIAEHQLQEGMISTLAESSLAVHPVPLYLIVVYLLVLLAIWKTKDRWKYNGSLALFTLSMLLGLRFFVEFFRDPTTNHALGAFVFGFKEIQWLLLSLVFLFTLLLILRERFGTLAINHIPKPTKGLTHQALLTTILLFFVWLGRDWFTVPESQIIHGYVLLPIVSLSVLQSMEISKYILL